MGWILPKFMGFLGSKASGYLMIFFATVCGFLYFAWRMEASNARDAYAEMGQCAAQLVQYQSSMEQCVQAVEDFALVARQNQHAAIQAEMRAAVAEDYVRIIREQADKDIEAAKREAEAFRNDGECRRLSDPLPADFAGWVFDDA